MQVINVKDLEDCLDSELSHEIFFISPITKKFIYYLGEEGELDYYADFPKPFFKILALGKYIIQGIEGSTVAKVILEKKNPKENLATLLSRIEKFQS